ncbi:hypothetical protein PF008_g8287 [Phytophthora fragariae]|uniref:Uncharacterized protein n=1 Tax=Phytophthora fragariae TaxID=53985 RepID=A0A6G0S003_9STRA|nr:hypothetical protein PF008_g8287 [Phytophthora fragariae]
MQVLKMSSQLDRGQLEEWLTTLGDGGTLLDDESEVHVGKKDPGAIAMILKLLWAYRDVSVNSGGCPPVTPLNVQHHIDTGSTAPIMQKRRRHAQMERSSTTM